MKQSIAYFAGLILTLASCSEKVKISPEQEKVFVKFYGNVYQDYGYDVKEVPGKGYAVVGKTTTKLNEDAPTTTDILFLLTDKLGNLRRDPQLFGGNDDDVGNSLALTSDGGFVIAGTSTDSASQETDVYVIRLNSEGNKLWERRLGGDGNQTGKQVKIASDNNILIAGESDDLPVLFSFADSETSEVNSLSRGISEFGYVINGVEEMHDAIRLIGYSSYQSYTFLNILYSPVDSWTDRTEAEYQVSEKILGHCLAAPDTLLVCGSKTTGGTQNGLLKKVIPGGDNMVTKFSKTFGNSGETVSAISVRMLYDGRIAVLATRTINENSDIVIYMFNRNGELLPGTIILGDNSVQEAGAFEITSDGGFIITGSNLLDNNSMVSLIKLNAAGALE